MIKLIFRKPWWLANPSRERCKPALWGKWWHSRDQQCWLTQGEEGQLHFVESLLVSFALSGHHRWTHPRRGGLSAGGWGGGHGSQCSGRACRSWCCGQESCQEIVLQQWWECAEETEDQQWNSKRAKKNVREANWWEKKPVSRTTKAGLVFSISRVHKRLRENRYVSRVRFLFILWTLNWTLFLGESECCCVPCSHLRVPRRGGFWACR